MSKVAPTSGIVPGLRSAAVRSWRSPPSASIGAHPDDVTDASFDHLLMRSTTLRRWIAGLAAFIALSSVDVAASPVVALSYSMPNGDGKAAGGGYNYWDGSYNGAGSTTTDGALLSGGLGALTDGVIATKVWNQVSNNAGTGQDVGWLHSSTPNPTIVFTFAAGTTINEVDIDLDNSGLGGVFAPSAILIDGINEAFTAPTAGTVGEVVIGGLNLAGASHTIQFDQAGLNSWTMVSEIGFAGNVPEPAAMTLFGLGVAVAAFARRRRKSSIR